MNFHTRNREGEKQQCLYAMLLFLSENSCQKMFSSLGIIAIASNTLPIGEKEGVEKCNSNGW